MIRYKTPQNTDLSSDTHEEPLFKNIKSKKMFDSQHTEQEDHYWSTRYQEAQTGWDIGAPSLPLKTYIDQLTNKDLRILIPGAGNAYEAEYLWQQGFKNVVVLDISDIPLQNLKERMPDFPNNQCVHGNFFEHGGAYDLVLEQTFFCSFPPTPLQRALYARTMANLLTPNGKLVGLWFVHVAFN